MAGARIKCTRRRGKSGKRWFSPPIALTARWRVREERVRDAGKKKNSFACDLALTSRTQDLLLASMRVVMPEADALSTAPGDRFKCQF